MEELKIFLNETGPQNDKKVRLAFGAIGISYIIIGSVSEYTQFKSAIFMFTIGGLFLLLYAIGYKKIAKRCYITLNENGISSMVLKRWGLFPKYEKSDIKWNQIKSLNIRVLKIEINLTNETVKEIEIGDLLYKDHQIFKQKLHEYIESKKIPLIV